MSRSSIESLEARRLMAADLTISVNLTVGAHKPGESGVYGAFTILNGGTQTATADFTVEAHLSTNTVYGDGDDIFGVSVPVTEDIGTGTFGGTLKPFGFNVAANVPAGPYYVVLKADAANAVAEGNENNNTVAGYVGTVTKADGTVPIYGSNSADSISVVAGINFIDVDVSGLKTRYLVDKTPGLDVQGYGGDDVIVLSGNIPNVNVFAGDGNDTVVGSDGNDFLAGGAGLDRIFGGLGNDRLNGNGGHDRLYGEGGADRLYGYDGNDYLDGGSSNDRLEGGAGVDSYYGQSGNDRLYCVDSAAEYVYGGSGTDSAQRDVSDILSSVEGVIA